MKKRIKKLSLFIILLLCSTLTVFAKPYNSLDERDTAIKFAGDVIFEEDKTESNKKYTTRLGQTSTILVRDSKVTLQKPTIDKTGEPTDRSPLTYGFNSAVFVYNNGSLNIIDGTINTDAKYGYGVFAFTDGNIIIKDSTIKTKKFYSSGIAANGGGNIDASNLEVVTEGSYSSAIKTSTGSGNITVNKGNYTTKGASSPVVYSTGKIKVTNANLKANMSEGVVIDGPNSVELNKVKLESMNISASDESKFKKNIMIYKSLNETVTEPGIFKSKNSTIKTYSGDTFFVTNTEAEINLENNKINNKTDNFLRIQKSVWGTDGLNGGKVALRLKNQKVDGNIIVDKISILSMFLSDNSKYEGIINGENQAKALSLHLDKNSKVILKGDSYISSLFNDDETNSNIYLNGHKLYVNNVEVEGNSKIIKKEVKKVEKVEKKENTFLESLKKAVPYLIDLAILIVIILIIMLFVFINNKKNNKMY